MESNITTRFQESVFRHQELFHLSISEYQLIKLTAYYNLLLKWNPLLHLTTLTAPEDFAVRQVLESGLATTVMNPSVRDIVDIGSGGGLPGVPIAILCPWIRVFLIEINKKKAIFLRETIDQLEIRNLAVINQPFKAFRPFSSDFCLTSRAIDKFSDHLSDIIDLGHEGKQILLFGGENLLRLIQLNYYCDWGITSYHIPCSENRFLISLLRST